MVGRDLPRIAFYNPFVSDTNWVVGSFRAEESCRALSHLGVTGIVASPFLHRRRELSDGFEAVPLPSSPLGCLKAFLELVRRDDFDLIQERPFSKGLVRNGYGLAASLDQGIPLIIELHNIGTPSSYVRRLPIHIPSLWHSDLILAYADVGRRTLFGASMDKTVAVPNGYSGELVESVIASRQGQFDLKSIVGDRMVFGFFGGLNATKGVDLILEVARRLRHREDICFVFAGKGNLVDRIRGEGSEPGSNVFYLGILDRYDALSCMSQCRSTLAVYDSQQSAAGNPVKIVESIALGVPVIINRELFVPEELKPYCTILHNRSPEAVAAAIVDDAASGPRLHAPRAVGDFSIEAISERIVLPAYKRILQKSDR